jgi:hypothetical protein
MLNPQILSLESVEVWIKNEDLLHFTFGHTHKNKLVEVSGTGLEDHPGLFLEFDVIPVLVVTAELGEIGARFGASDGGSELDVRCKEVAGLS